MGNLIGKKESCSKCGIVPLGKHLYMDRHGSLVCFKCWEGCWEEFEWKNPPQAPISERESNKSFICQDCFDRNGKPKTKPIWDLM